MRFTPRYTPDRFKAFFTGPEAWGTLRQTRRGQTQRNELSVVEGRFAASSLHLDAPGRPTRVRVTLGRAVVPAVLKPAMEGVMVELQQPVIIGRGQTLAVTLS